MENPNNLAYVLIAFLFTFTSVLASYLALNVLDGITFDMINASPSQFAHLKEKILTAKSLMYTGVLFTVIAFLFVYIFTWGIKFKNKVFFFAGIAWSIAHIALSVGMAVFVLPVAITLLAQRDKHFHPQKYETPRITAAQRMAKMQEQHDKVSETE